MSFHQDDYNKSGMIAFVFSMAFTLVFFIIISFFHPGVNLHEVKEEVKAVAAAAPAAKVDEAPKAFDPATVKEAWISSPELIAHGQEVFKTACAVCHGDKGDGNGPAGAALNPKPRNFIEGKWKKGGTSLGLFDVVTNGLSGTSMAPFGHLPVVDRWSLVHFIRSITKNKVADDDAKLKAAAASLK